MTCIWVNKDAKLWKKKIFYFFFLLWVDVKEWMKRGKQLSTVKIDEDFLFFVLSNFEVVKFFFLSLNCHTKTVRNKRCKLKVIYLNKFLSNCNVNTIKISGFFQSFWKNYFFLYFVCFPWILAKMKLPTSTKNLFSPISDCFTKGTPPP